MTERKNEDEVWKKVFEILEWTGKTIIPYAGCQELVKKLKEIKITSNGTGEQVRVLRGENCQLKKDKRTLEQEVSSLKAQLEDGRRVEGKLKRKLKVSRESYKGKLLKLAESICESEETGEEMEGESENDDDESVTSSRMDESDSDEVESPVATLKENSVRTDKHQGSKKEENRHMVAVVAQKSIMQVELPQSNEMRRSTSTAGIRTPLKSKNRTVRKAAAPDEVQVIDINAAVQPQPVTMGKGFARGSGQLTLAIPDQTEELMGPPNPKQLTTGQQTFLKAITDDCLSVDAAKQFQAMAKLSDDPRTSGILREVVTFISENIPANENNFRALQCLLRMLSKMTNNPNINLGPQMKEIRKCISRIIITPEESGHADQDHWGLRDSAVKLLKKTCNMYGSTANSEIRASFRSVLESEASSLGSVYGAVAALGKLGDDAIKEDLIPVLRGVGDRLKLRLAMNKSSDTVKASIEKIRDLVVGVGSPIVMSTRSAPDRLKDYNAHFSYFGESLQKSVIQLRRKERGQRLKNSFSGESEYESDRDSKYRLREHDSSIASLYDDLN